MLRLATAQLWVHDQDEALAFYTQKVGFEVKADVKVPELGSFRWLTVGPPGQHDVTIALLPVPEPPMVDAATTAAIREVMARGVAGAVFLTTNDCHATYVALKARGVEFSQRPEARPYGIDTGFRDPFGNQIRVTQITAAAPTTDGRP